jgi:hypothetical protein
MAYMPSMTKSAGQRGARGLGNATGCPTETKGCATTSQAPEKQTLQRRRVRPNERQQQMTKIKRFETDFHVDLIPLTRWVVAA